MEFLRKNYVTILVVGATVVLAGVAIFTALRLYQLRDTGIAPNQPDQTEAEEAPVSVSPSSANWDLPDMYIVTNVSDEDLDIVWNLDCWDETVCEDSDGAETLSPGESFEAGLGVICSQWQLSLNYSGTATVDGDVWDWAESSQIDPECDFQLDFSDPDATDEATTQDITDDEELVVDTQSEDLDLLNLENQETEMTADFGSFAVQQCTNVLAFSLGTDVTSTPTATPTPVVSATPTPIASVAPSVTPSPVVTSTPVASPTAQPELPEAGIAVPTVIGIGAGAIFLIIAMALAL